MIDTVGDEKTVAKKESVTCYILGSTRNKKLNREQGTRRAVDNNTVHHVPPTPSHLTSLLDSGPIHAETRLLLAGAKHLKNVGNTRMPFVNTPVCVRVCVCVCVCLVLWRLAHFCAIL